MGHLEWAYIALTGAVWVFAILVSASKWLRNKLRDVLGKGRRRKAIVAAVLVVLGVLVVLVDAWALRSFVWSHLVFITGIFAFAILISVSSQARNELRDVLGEAGRVRSTLRFVFGLAVAAPIWIFVLLYRNGQVTIPPTVEFNIITVSGLLGGLVISAARRESKNEAAYKELISVGQKFILATILLILFAVSFFMLQAIGGDIDVNRLEWSNQGIARGVSFWLMLPCFLGGTSLFSLAMVDLVMALRNIGRGIRKSDNKCPDGWTSSIL